jgi:hypothetical protein
VSVQFAYATFAQHAFGREPGGKGDHFHPIIERLVIPAGITERRLVAKALRFLTGVYKHPCSGEWVVVTTLNLPNRVLSLLHQLLHHKSPPTWQKSRIRR